jgi:hypothetical protein
VALLSKMFSLAIRWGWRADNPAKGVERNHEEKRQRYLSALELSELIKALAEHADQQAANPHFSNSTVDTVQGVLAITLDAAESMRNAG